MIKVTKQLATCWLQNKLFAPCPLLSHKCLYHRKQTIHSHSPHHRARAKKFAQAIGKVYKLSSNFHAHISSQLGKKALRLCCSASFFAPCTEILRSQRFSWGICAYKHTQGSILTRSVLLATADNARSATVPFENFCLRFISTTQIFFIAEWCL